MNIPEKVCQMCNNIFKPTNNKQRYCKDCGQIHQKEYQRAYDKVIHKEINCIICNKPFIQKSTTNKYCSDECMRIGRNLNKKRLRGTLSGLKKCSICGKDFKFTTSGQKYCEECKSIARERQIKLDKQRAKIKKNTTEYGYKKTPCIDCGIIIEYKYSKKKRCDSCLIIHNKNAQKSNSEKRYKESPEKYREQSRLYRAAHKEEISARAKIRKKRKMQDPLYRLANTVGCMMRDVLVRNNNYGKNTRSIEYLGCSIEYLKEHLEKQFEPWMNWENYGKYPDGWDIDHSTPLATATTIDELLPLLWYTNLQPLNSYINRNVKRDKINFVIPLI